MATSGAMPSRPTSKKKPPVPAPEPPKVLSVEERTAYLEDRLKGAPEDAQAKYRADLDMSWIAHDSALEGVVYTLAELRSAMGANDGDVAFDSSLQPVVEEIRRHREALNFVREQATKRRVPITVDVIKRIYCVLHPEEGDVKTVKYRKDIHNTASIFTSTRRPTRLPTSFARSSTGSTTPRHEGRGRPFGSPRALTTTSSVSSRLQRTAEKSRGSS
jgi:hypothetical protein